MSEEKLPGRLMDLREERMWTQGELSEHSGVSPATINKIENDHIERPRFSTVRKLARALEVSPGELWIGREGQVHETPKAKALTLHSPAAEELLSEQGAEWGFLTEDAFASKVHRGAAGDNDSEFERVERELLPEVGAEKVRILDALSTQRPRSADYRRLRREVSAYYNMLIMALINYGAALSGGEVPAQRTNQYELA